MIYLLNAWCGHISGSQTFSMQMISDTSSFGAFIDSILKVDTSKIKLKCKEI